MFRTIVFASVAVAAVSAPAAGSTVVIGKPDWPSAQVTAHIIAEVATGQLGYDVRLREVGTIELIGAIDRGEVDVHPEVWLPNGEQIIAPYLKSGSLRLSPVSVSGTQSMCTTRQTMEETGLKSLADLTKPEMAAHFDTDQDGRGEMWIGSMTWSSTRIERVRARSYGYDDTMMLITMPEDQAMAAVDAAVATGSPIVFYCYTPHYLFALHDVVRLEEPSFDPSAWTIVTAEQDPAWLSLSQAPTAWQPSRYHVGYAASLMKDAPEMASFLDKMEITPQDAEAMSYAVHVEGRAPDEIARTFVAQNADRIAEWVK